MKHPNDPKQGPGALKIPFAAVPWTVMAELAVGFGEGELKYGRNNWRKTQVVSSTYFAAAMRHLTAWWEGEDIDPDSGMPHIVKAMASLGILRDAQIAETAIDDRPPPTPEGFMDRLNAAMADLASRYGDQERPAPHVKGSANDPKTEIMRLRMALRGIEAMDSEAGKIARAILAAGDPPSSGGGER